MDANIAASCRTCFFRRDESSRSVHSSVQSCLRGSQWVARADLIYSPLRVVGLSDAIRAAWSVTGHSFPTPWMLSGPP